MPYQPTANLRFSASDYTPSAELRFCGWVPSAALVFRDPPTDSAALVFDDRCEERAEAPESGDHVLTLDAFLPHPAPTLEALLEYDANVQRILAMTTEERWQKARPASAETGFPWGDASQAWVETADAWHVALPVSNETALSWQDNERAHYDTAERWRDARPAAASYSAPWVYLERAEQSTGLPWHDGRKTGASALLFYEYLKRSGAETAEQWALAAPLAHDISSRHHVAERLSRDPLLPWHETTRPRPGLYVYEQPDIGGPGPDLYDPTAQLVFCFPWEPTAAIIFNRLCSAAQVVVPIRRIYLVSSSAEFVRLPDREPIPASAVTVSIDWDSWAWSLSATLTGQAAADLIINAGSHDPAEAVEVEATINGYTWIAVAEQIDRSRQFNGGGYNLQARGRAAYLSDPYDAPAMRSQAAPRNAQQLAAEALGFTDWDLDWTAADWLIPAGVWNHTGTVMQALNRLAEAAGAAVQAHRHEGRIAVQPRYPAWPWHWQEPDAPVALSIPEDIVTRLAHSPTVYPGYDAIYISGEDQGVLARVLRDGSPGTTAMQMIVDPLCTHETMARVRGGTVLAHAGRVSEEMISMPISDEMPLCEVGQLLEITAADGDWRGVVIGVEVTANWQAGLQVRQAVTLERWRNG